MNKKLHTDCPGYEDISAFFDDELDVNSPEYFHIKECQSCQLELEAYRKVDRSIKSEFSDAVPDGFADDLIVAIRARQKREASSDPLPFRGLLRVAALFLICGIVVYALITASSGPIVVNTVISPSEPLVFLNNKQPYQDFSNCCFQPSRKYAAGTENSIDMRKFMNVSVGNSNEKYLPGFKDQSKRTAFIKPIVSQTWSVDNLQRAEGEIAKFADSSRIEKNKSGNLVAKFDLTKKELAELVRRYKKSGFRLLSPSQPQPEQTIFAGNQDDKVKYTATFVEPE